MYECRGRQDAGSGHQRARDAPDQGVEQTLELAGRGGRNAMEARAFALEGVNAVEHEDVDMHIEVDRRPKPLNEGHETGFSTARAQPRSPRERRGQCLAIPPRARG
jgi:hypothetical protein